MMETTGSHRMGRRDSSKNYCWPGTYHITIKADSNLRQPFGRVIGDVGKADSDDDAPRVELTAIGRMVEEELTKSITAHYPMVEVHEHVVMPEHLHCIIVVTRDIVSSNGRKRHLGEVIAGFKKGCNRRYWEIIGMTADGLRGKPADTGGQADGQQGELRGKPADAGGQADGQQGELRGAPADAGGLRRAVYPHGYKVPSRASTGRPPLFEHGYVDVMPLREGQLEQQREYIRNNPRNRLLRSSNRLWLQPQRGGIDTALKLIALRGYLQRECAPSQFNADIWEKVKSRLNSDNGFVACDSYGNRELLDKRLLPVVCHRRDSALFAIQKEKCLSAASEGAVLISARIAEGEREIMDAATSSGYPIVVIDDNGMPEIYHPSEYRTDLCANSHLLIVTPWNYHYRHSEENISVAECKTMNCVAQALSRTKDSWWKQT